MTQLRALRMDARSETTDHFLGKFNAALRKALHAGNVIEYKEKAFILSMAVDRDLFEVANSYLWQKQPHDLRYPSYEGARRDIQEYDRNDRIK